VKKENNEIWLISDNEEDFSYSEEYDSKERAIEEARKMIADEDESGTCFYIGKQKIFIPNMHHLAAAVFDQLGESAYDEVGEFADDWPHFSEDNTKLLEVKLSKIISEWLNEKVVNIEQV
jgi:hypothetical protein